MFALMMLGHFQKWKISKNLIYDFMFGLCLVNADVNDAILYWKLYCHIWYFYLTWFFLQTCQIYQFLYHCIIWHYYQIWFVYIWCFLWNFHIFHLFLFVKFKSVTKEKTLRLSLSQSLYSTNTETKMLSRKSAWHEKSVISYWTSLSYSANAVNQSDAGNGIKSVVILFWLICSSTFA